MIYVSHPPFFVTQFSFLQMRDEKEGPVTKSIRLTASLILKKIMNYVDGKFCVRLREAFKKKSRAESENGTFSLYTPPPPI